MYSTILVRVVTFAPTMQHTRSTVRYKNAFTRSRKFSYTLCTSTLYWYVRVCLKSSRSQISKAKHSKTSKVSEVQKKST